MKFTLFHLRPYADLDLEAAAEYQTSWLQTPNTFYDAEKVTVVVEAWQGESLRA